MLPSSFKKNPPAHISEESPCFLRLPFTLSFLIPSRQTPVVTNGPAQIPSGLLGSHIISPFLNGVGKSNQRPSKTPQNKSPSLSLSMYPGSMRRKSKEGVRYAICREFNLSIRISGPKKILRPSVAAVSQFSSTE